MKKKDLLLESFDAKLQKIELNSIYGGSVAPSEIAQRNEGTAIPEGTKMDTVPDQH